MRKPLFLLAAWTLLSFGAGMAEASDISVRVADPEMPGAWKPVTVQREGTMTSENLPSPFLTVHAGENQALNSVFLVADAEGPQAVHVGSRITLTLPVGVEYMQIPTAETLDSYVAYPSMLNWFANSIFPEGDQPALRFVAATPRSLTVEIAHMRSKGMPFVEFVFYAKDRSMVRISPAVSWSQKKGDGADTMTRQEFFTYYIDVAPSLKGIEERVKGEESDLLRPFGDAQKVEPELRGRVAGLVKENLVIGRPGKQLAPDAPITRAEAVTLVTREQQWDTPASPAFADLETSWALGPISAAGAKGLVKGYPDGAFCPEQPLSWEEAVLLLGRVYDSNLSRRK
ncbi:hypothetical protein GTO89_12470 [Heliobacterium gestii]|uniref:SLH domain-containing protein n=1 Tax=Heliomicrobium gestii TaxID=2699 RepID=A0A845LE64_HELGE|nr:S-layer homology domain-containing protein [Heliomicrobium gestii]MBM7867297.1 hypothetical protein [Heliomicrobium gestii]MZP43851.1 hypothetical protein [Heliomicrobium gestii]